MSQDSDMDMQYFASKALTVVISCKHVMDVGVCVCVCMVVCMCVCVCEHSYVRECACLCTCLHSHTVEIV